VGQAPPAREGQEKTNPTHHETVRVDAGGYEEAEGDGMSKEVPAEEFAKFLADHGVVYYRYSWGTWDLFCQRCPKKLSVLNGQLTRQKMKRIQQLAVKHHMGCEG